MSRSRRAEMAPGRRRAPARGMRRAVLPGLVAGAADVDPTTVATVAIVGATTVYGLSWLVLLLFPMLAVIQIISVRVGRGSGGDLQACVKRRFSMSVQVALLVSVLAVGIVTAAADLEAGAAALGLLTGGPWRDFVVPLAALLIGLLIFGGYNGVQRLLQYVLLCLLAYVVAALLAHPQWRSVLHATVVPHVGHSGSFLEGALALVGTTLTSYVFVWQTIEVAQRSPTAASAELDEIGAASGALFLVVVCWFILVATGATLGVHHIGVDTADQAARALRPVAGPAAGAVFGVGLLASAVVAVPVILATGAYVLGAQFNWPAGLSVSVSDAPRFYGVLILSALIGAAGAHGGVSPIRMLLVASVLAGLALPIGLICLVLIAGDRRIMRGNPVPLALLAAGWTVALAVSLVDLVYLANQLGG